MALREEMRRSGEWLFRWRSYIPLLPLAAVLAELLGRDQYPGGTRALWNAWGLTCLAVSALGLVVRALTVGFVPGGTSGRNTGSQRAESLNTTGVYSLVRHPLYVGNYLMWLGVLLLPRELGLLTAISLVYWFYYERIMFAEEEFLRESFGETFERWAERTPAVLPRWRNWVPPRLGFSLRTVLKREPSSFFGMISTFTAAECAARYGAEGEILPSALWAGVFGVGLTVFVVLVVLKRHTRVLHVEGR